ncbi:TIGR00153 family protein [uncultured Oceanicoccus sp.]|uniref:TIGR00153 family protein n=1 Tax=uncultured Oceanicoccus sp. TaxID=1706381 RepID=UPI0030D8EE15
MAGNPFGNLFGQSPIRPIQQHMATAHSCASKLNDYFAAVIAADWDQAKDLQKQIAKLESDADKLKKQVRLNMPKSLFMPVPRSDLLDLVTMQDKIANCAKDIAGIMLGRKMAIPEKIAPTMIDYVHEAVATSAQALTAIQEMDELLTTGFRGREVQVVQDLIKELDRLEHKNDKLQIKIRAMLFKLEKDLPPVDVMFLYKIIDWVGELADRAQKVGSRLQRLIAS